MKCAGRITVCALAAMLLFVSCGKAEPESDGLVPMETAKGYEHVAKVESAGPTPSPGVQEPDGNQPQGSEGEPDVTTPPDTVTPEPSQDIVYVAVSKLNLRSAPSLESEVIVQVKYGESFVRIEKGTEGWDKLLYNDQEVYAYAEFLSEKKVADGRDMFSGAVMAEAKKKMDIVDTTKQLYSYDELCGDLKELKDRYPDGFTYQSVGVSADGRNIYEVAFGSPVARKKIIIQAGIHAREYMTSQLVMAQLEFYLSLLGDTVYGGTTVRELFDTVSIHLFPMMTPDGISISQYGLDGISDVLLRADIKNWYDRDKTNGQTDATFENYMKLWKANARGVDLNRNFNYGFAEYSGAKNPGAMKYKGTAPASEAETAALIRRTEELSPVLAISYHASGSVIYWDYGQTGELRTKCKALVDIIHGVNQNEIRYAATDKQDAAGYGDWLVMEKGIPSATVEIGVGAAPLAAEEFAQIWERNAPMWAALAGFAKENSR